MFSFQKFAQREEEVSEVEPENFLMEPEEQAEEFQYYQHYPEEAQAEIGSETCEMLTQPTQQYTQQSPQTQQTQRLTQAEAQTLNETQGSEEVAANEAVTEPEEPPHHRQIEVSIKQKMQEFLQSSVEKKVTKEIIADKSSILQDTVRYLEVEKQQIEHQNGGPAAQVTKIMQDMALNSSMVEENEKIISYLSKNIQRLGENLGRLKADRCVSMFKALEKNVLNLSELRQSRMNQVRDKWEGKKATTAKKIEFLKEKLHSLRESEVTLLNQISEVTEVTRSVVLEINEKNCAKKITEEELVKVEGELQKAKDANDVIIRRHEEMLREKLSERDKEIKRMSELKMKREEFEAEARQKKADISQLLKEIEEIDRNCSERTSQLNAKNEESQRMQLDFREQEKETALKLDEISSDLKTSEEDLEAIAKRVAMKLNDIEKLKEEYLHASRVKSQWTNNLIEVQSSLHKEEIISLEKKMEELPKQRKVEFLEERLEELKSKIPILDNELSEEANRLSKEISLEQSRYQKVTVDQNTFLEEIGKKKEYLLATGIYMTQKLTSLGEELSKLKETSEKETERHSDLLSVMKEKENEMVNLKMQLENMREPRKKPLSSIIKNSPAGGSASKKVKFNSDVFYKSSTEDTDSKSSQIAFMNFLD